MSELCIAALARKRAELSGEIEAGEVRLCELRAGLAHVDATIRLFAPEYPIAAIAAKRPRHKRPVLFGKGELGRTVLDILRTAEGPLTVAQIEAEVMTRLGLAEDRGVREFLESRVDRGLRRQATQGLVEKVTYGPQAVGRRITGHAGCVEYELVGK